MNDVLAEIRRLVTEEERGRRRESAGTAEPLILTREMRVDLPEAEPDSAPHRREAPEENAETAPANEATGTAEAGRAAEADVAPLASEAPSAPQDTAPAAEPPDPAEAEFDAHVRAIVRAELEGALGERISANLRKIIRREVTRALNARLGE